MAEWRTGRSVGRTIYRDDVLVGMVDTPEIAAEVVAALNSQICGHTTAGLTLRHPLLICARREGHDGAHANASGAQWVATNRPEQDGPATVRCPTCGDDVRPGRFDSYGQHPRSGQAELCPGRQQ